MVKDTFVLLRMPLTLILVMITGTLIYNPSSLKRTEAPALKTRDVIDRYVKARRELRLSTAEIAQKIFNVSLPLLNRRNPRHSYPLLTGSTLEAFADFSFQGRKLRRRQRKTGNGTTMTTATTTPKATHYQRCDILFVMGIHADAFARKVLPTLPHPFILITHGSDAPVPKGQKALEMLDNDKLYRWFTRNAAIIHPKLVPVPIGFNNANGVTHSLPHQPEKMLPHALHIPTFEQRPIFIYSNFDVSENKNSLRKTWKEAFGKFNQTISPRRYKEKNQVQYWEDLKKSKFVLSPPGQGEDCFRTWESILFGAIPVVRNSSLWPLFEKSPVFVVPENEDFTDETVRSETVRRMAEFVPSPKRSRKVVTAQYWFDIITAHKHECLKSSGKPK